MDIKYSNEDVAVVYGRWSEGMRKKILHLRALIFDVAKQTPGTGELVETLKWNVPAYLTARPKSGTSIRLQGDNETGRYGVYVPCSTTLIEQCRELYPDVFIFSKNRGVVFKADAQVPEAELRHFIAMALTYHLKSSPNS